MISTESPRALARAEPGCVYAMTTDNPSVPSRDRDGKKSTVVKDTAETLYAGTDHIAKGPECGRETLWCDRENFTHRDECPYYEVARQ